MRVPPVLSLQYSSAMQHLLKVTQDFFPLKWPIKSDFIFNSDWSSDVIVGCSAVQWYLWTKFKNILHFFCLIRCYLLFLGAFSEQTIFFVLKLIFKVFKNGDVFKSVALRSEHFIFKNKIVLDFPSSGVGIYFLHCKRPCFPIFWELYYIFFLRQASMFSHFLRVVLYFYTAGVHVFPSNKSEQNSLHIALKLKPLLPAQCVLVNLLLFQVFWQNLGNTANYFFFNLQLIIICVYNYYTCI